MFEILNTFKSFFKYGGIVNDNIIFRLHYKLTVMLLLIFTLVLSSKQLSSNPIECMDTDNGESMNPEDINTYCWTYGTYTLGSRLNGEQGQMDSDKGVRYNETQDKYNYEQIPHTYYQWVDIILLMQAIMFYIPRYLWKFWEGGRLCSLTTNLCYPIIPEEWSEFRRDQIITYFSYTTPCTHKYYAIKYCICEVLNFVNVIGQIFLLDELLGGSFRDYGTAITSFSRVHKMPTIDEMTPVDRYFPRIAKCRLSAYGTTGDLITTDKLCVLPLNVFNEKIFATLWFWFIMLAVVSGIAVIVRIVVINVPKLQSFILLSQLRIPFNRLALEELVKRHGFGGWFVLNLLGENMNPTIFKDLINELVKEDTLLKEHDEHEAETVV